MKLKIRTEAAISIAKEFTIAAIESGLIPKSTNAAQAGNNVADFMDALLVKLTEDE